MGPKKVTRCMDVFYVGGNVGGFAASYVSIFRSWDGSLYAETNVQDWAGANQPVSLWTDGVTGVWHQRSNCGAPFSERRLMQEGHQH